MRGRKPKSVVLKPTDAKALRQLLRAGDLPQRVARRARILLARAQKERIEQVVTKVDQDRATVWRVCQRYAQTGLQAALYDAPRSGRPRVFFPAGSPAPRTPGVSFSRNDWMGVDALVDAEFGAGGGGARHRVGDSCRHHLPALARS